MSVFIHVLQNNIPPIPLPFVMPTIADFEKIDGSGNNDTRLTMEELAQYVGCDTKTIKLEIYNIV